MKKQYISLNAMQYTNINLPMHQLPKKRGKMKKVSIEEKRNKETKSMKQSKQKQPQQRQ